MVKMEVGERRRWRRNPSDTLFFISVCMVGVMVVGAGGGIGGGGGGG